MIALLFYILLTDYIYDVFATEHSVFWAIFYFSNNYLALALVSIKAIEMINSRWAALCYSIAIGYTIKTIIELSKIGMTYDEYYVSVNTYFSHLIFSIPLTTLIILSYAGEKKYNK